jgi:hypothetical protein
LPKRLAELGQLIATPDIIDQNIKPSLFFLHSFEERLHVILYRMVGLHMNTGASERGNHLGSLFYGLGAISAGRFPSNAAASAVHRCAGFTERAGYTATSAPSRARDDRNFAIQWQAPGLFLVSP